ncbi:hypothetical protein [Desulfatirhabdium butyrativorans]|uniref:hypothetical protein n=1 Tax=Desulfatirhabdium butyrativorans TaxID=340467 RepID=UPI0003F7A61E|nr:hypothetical protein [Desulfatirhabdium butyrativorans]
MPQSLRKRHIPEALFQHVEGIEKKKRTPMPELPVAERIRSFAESDLVISEQNALHEADRCLNCCRLCTNVERAAA